MMSTSDAAQCELRAETPHSGAAGARTAASRNQKYERLRRENRRPDQRPIRRQSFPSATTQEAAHTALILSDVSFRSEDTPHQPVRPSFTSCLFLRLCSRPDLRTNENPDLRTNENPDLRTNESQDLSLHGLPRRQHDDSCCQNKGQTSGSSVTIFSGTSSSGGKLFTDWKNGDGVTVISKELDANRDYSISHSVSLRESGSGLYVGPRLKALKSDSQTDPEERYKPSRTMLSSSVVTVLAPHWSSRLRRNRRLEGTSNPEAQGSLQDVTKPATNCVHEWYQETADRSLTDRWQEPLRVPFHGTRRNTEDWSSKSGPASLDYGCKRKTIHSVSLDVKSGCMDNRKIDAAASSPLATPLSPQSPLSLQPHVQRRDQQTKNQGGLSSFSSKPTTSSLLLSLRRFNSSSRISNAAPPLSEINPASSDQKGKLFPTRLPQTPRDKNDQDKFKPLQSPSSISCKTTETPPLLFSNQKERMVFDTHFFSASPINKDAEDASSTQQAQTVTRAASSLLCSKQVIVSRGLTDRQPNFRGSDTNLFSESSGSSPRPSYNRSACLHPRQTTLTSTSWWKQVSQEGSSPLKLNDTSVKDKLNTPFAPPNNNNNNSDLASAGPTDIKRFNSPIANNRDNNNTTESFCKGNMNLLMKPQGGSQSVRDRISEDSPEQDSDKLQNESNVHSRGPLKPQSSPNVFHSSKMIRASPQTLSHPNDLRECDVTELPPTGKNPKSLNSPTESTSKSKNNQCAITTNSSPTSPYYQDFQSLSNPLLSSSATNTPNNQALTSQTASSLHPTNTTTKTVFNHLHTPSHTSSSSQTSIFTNPVNSKPLGFKRSFHSAPPQPKAASCLIPTFKVFSKTEPSPSTSLSTTADNPAAPAFPRSSLLTPAPATLSIPITIPSLLTPPATPIITSPNSDSSSPQEGKDFSSSHERGSKKRHSEEKRVRRVTWEDSVDLQHSEPIKNPERPSASPLSSSKSSPTTNTYPVCSPTSRTSSIQALKGGKYRSLSSDSADLVSRVQHRSELRANNPLTFDQKTQEEPRQDRPLSVEPGTVLSSAPPSLPLDFLRGYKLRYSSPPYSTLMSTRSTTGESKTVTPRSQLFQNPMNYSPHLSKQTDSAMTSPMSKPPLSPSSLLQPTSTQESSKFGVSETYQVSNKNSQGQQNSTILLVKNRVDIGSQSLQEAKGQTSSPTCVTETLVYCVKSKALTESSNKSTSKLLQQAATGATENKFSKRPHKVQSQETAGEPGNHSEQSSSGSSSTDSRSTDDGNRKMKNSALCKSRLFSVESNNEQSPKRSLFALKKSVSTPNASLSRSETDRANKTNNKMDQVLSRLRQTFSSRRSDEDLSFPWKWRRGSQTPSVGGLSDISSDVPAETKTLEEPEQEEAKVLEDTEEETQNTNRWTRNRHSHITTTTASRGPVTAGKFDSWSDQLPPGIHQGQNACTEHVSERKIKPLLTIQSPTTHLFNFPKDNRMDYKSTTQLLPCRDPSPGRSSNLSTGFPPQFRKSTPSPRSPFSPFSSLSPVSPFPSPEVTDDNVFYSPKLQRRRESPSPVEPREGISLRASRRSQASTGPPSAGPEQDKDCSSSYADLKYGIEPGRSFSVSSVLSSRPSGPGRISTGSRFKSVGDLSESALTSGGTETDPWSVSPDWTTGYDSLPSKDCLMAYFPSDPSKMKTRSLPRSLTRRLANWSSGVSASPSVTMATSKPARLWSPTLNTCHFAWDTEGPPTPPPTPPLSPVSRPLSTPPSLSSPTCPISSGPQKVDSLSSRGRLPSKVYVSSLSTFEESSDSSSGTTTDDEYYLETGEDEKETEL